MKSMKFMTLILIISIILSGCGLKTKNANEKITPKDALINYQDNRFNFSIEYPKNWTSKVQEWVKGTADQEVSPDTGIQIFIDGKQEEKIYIFGQVSTLAIPNEEGTLTEKFKTVSGLDGKLYIKNLEGKKEIYLVLDEEQLTSKSYKGRSLGAYVHVGLDNFKKNEEKVMDILRSIKITK